ncbi:MAG TPA: AAA family ATPase [Actinomycetota bacterium]|nr:AAA family ATPase [Actinomycetota bacterium]
MLKKTEASHVERIPRTPDLFRRVAAEHRADVELIRERNRRRRLRYLLYLNVLLFAYFAKRALEGNPIRLGLPQLGPDAIIWLFPLLILLMISVAVLLPFAQGRSPHLRFSPEQLGITFSDVRGIDTVLEEVTRTLQIFLTYKTFREELGGNPRRGILFEGRPGTGKTHLAKAMASEAGVPFFFVSAPAFQSMFFGMTAWKIRSFFKGLKKAALKEGGAIGFIEEIDAIGGARGGVESTSRVAASPFSTLRFGTADTGSMVNELLIQLQSFEAPPFSGRMKNRLIDLANLFLPAQRQIRKRPSPYSNVLIIGATNRADALDPALLRPGRFDRALYFDLPGRVGRRDLLDYFLSKRAHASEMDREDLRDELAAMTLGYSPAMLEHILDEALVWALRDGRRELNWRDIQRARLSEEIGIAHPVAYTDRERETIATHEAGHAVAAFLCAKDRKLEVLSIIKRRQALGLLAHSDTEERFTRTHSELEATMKVALGGMAAEQLFFGESGTGPASDLQAATALAAQMVGSFGMGSSLVSYDAVTHGPHSPNIVAKVLNNDDTKREVDGLLRKMKDQVGYLLETNRDLVEALRDALLEHDEIMGDEINAVIEQALARRTGEPTTES